MLRDLTGRALPAVEPRFNQGFCVVGGGPGLVSPLVHPSSPWGIASTGIAKEARMVFGGLIGVTVTDLRGVDGGQGMA